jgi:DNA modification methylase
MSLKQKIVDLLSQSGKKMTMKEIYTHFPDIAKTTVRGRVYNAMGSGIERIGKGLYVSSKAIVEQGDSLEIIDRMINEGDRFDFIFLDIPYEAGGQRGGNRNLFELDKITPDQFGTFIGKCEELLSNDNSPLVFMFTSGRSSKRAHDAYFEKIKLKQCKLVGSYRKMWPNGRPMNMGKYTMPLENIYFFSRSGEIEYEPEQLNFELAPDLKEYPTAKPYPMIRRLIELFAKPEEWVLDPFAGSGKVLRACLELGRYCHSIDSSQVSVEKHLMPLL